MDRTPATDRCATRRRHARSFALVAAVLAGIGGPASPLAAQDPAEATDAEAEREAVDPWSASAELAFTHASGNQDFSVLTSELVLGHASGNLYDAELRLQARYGSTNGDALARAFQGAINLDLRPLGHWSPFVFSTAEHDESKLLRLRLNSGAGAKYRLARADGRGQASVSLAVLDSYEALETEDEDPTHSARYRLGLEARQELRDGVSIAHTSRFEPDAGALDDYLLSVDTTMKVLLTQRVALSVSYEFDQDSTPATAEIETNDHLMKAGVIVQL